MPQPFSIETKFSGDFWKLVRRTPEIYETEMRKGLEASVMHLHGKVFEKTPVFQQDLGNSITTALEGKGLEIYGRVGTPSKYALPIEHGRLTGKWPNIEALKNWVVRKGIQPKEGRNIRQVVFLIARAIKNRGFAPPHTKGWKMFEKTFKQEQGTILKLLGEARDRIVARLGG